MDHKNVEAEITKKCEKCGFSGFPHSVSHRSRKPLHYDRGNATYGTEAMVFTRTRCGYRWLIDVK